ncbi:MAG: FAD-dependent oxidoreductase, partial [Synergistaceae bacterium]
TSLILASGKEIPCDFVVVAAGVKPAVAFLEGSGIKTDKSVCTDEYMRTNIANVWAAGDVAGITGIWPNAMEQGEVAAKNMLGIPTPYDNRYGLKNAMNFFGLSTLSLGAALPSDGDEVYARESKSQYERLIVRGGTVVGVIIQGDISNKGIWQEIVKNKISLCDIKKSPFNISYADFYRYNPKDASFEWSE